MLNTKTPPISKRLKKIRGFRGLSQKALGIKSGIDEFSASARMNQYETGKHVPDYNTLTRIAKVLKVPVVYFYCDNDSIAELILAWSKLTKSEKDQLLVHAQMMGDTTDTE